MAGKADIVDKVASEVDGLSKVQASEAFDAIFDTVVSYLVDDERVQVPGFGSFSVSHRKAREGRNPQTGEAIQIAARKVPKFRASSVLKDELNS